MVFASLTFLSVFLPLTVLVYHLIPQRLKNSFLLLASLIFYLWGSGSYLAVLIAVVTINFACGQLIRRAQERESKALARLALVSAAALSLGILGFFKYSGFAVEQLNFIAAALGAPSIAWAAPALPIGISFFTFQALSYVFDLSRGTSRPLRNPLDFALYVSLFPQLIAGPIVRYHDIEAQLRSRSSSLDQFSSGTLRFSWGLVKKVIIADGVAQLANGAFATPTPELSAAAAWIGIVAYTVQIYFDFSGYSDMALGLASIFGFTLPENFRRPYSAISITDFWRRWHISLSTWFRDYLYIPLGGSRGGAGRTYFNLCTVFLLTGVWHGANWTFILWGVLHGCLLVFERATGRNYREHAPSVLLQRTTTLLLVTLAWVLFRADSVSHALGYYAAMFTPELSSHAGLGLSTFARDVSPQSLFLLAAGLLSVALPGNFVLGPWLRDAEGTLPAVARTVLVCGLLPYSLFSLAAGSFSPFLYFQF